MRRHVEISRHFIHIYASCESTPFFRLKSLDSLLQIVMIINVSFMMVPWLNYRSFLINSIFNKVSIEVNNMGSDNILHVKRQDVARNVREIDIKVDRELYKVWLTFWDAIETSTFMSDTIVGVK